MYKRYSSVFTETVEYGSAVANGGLDEYPRKTGTGTTDCHKSFQAAFDYVSDGIDVKLRTDVPTTRFLPMRFDVYRDDYVSNGTQCRDRETFFLSFHTATAGTGFKIDRVLNASYTMALDGNGSMDFNGFSRPRNHAVQGLKELCDNFRDNPIVTMSDFCGGITQLMSSYLDDPDLTKPYVPFDVALERSKKPVYLPLHQNIRITVDDGDFNSSGDDSDSDDEGPPKKKRRFRVQEVKKAVTSMRQVCPQQAFSWLVQEKPCPKAEKRSPETRTISESAAAGIVLQKVTDAISRCGTGPPLVSNNKTNEAVFAEFSNNMQQFSDLPDKYVTINGTPEIVKPIYKVQCSDKEKYNRLISPMENTLAMLKLCLEFGTYEQAEDLMSAMYAGMLRMTKFECEAKLGNTTFDLGIGDLARKIITDILTVKEHGKEYLIKSIQEASGKSVTSIRVRGNRMKVRECSAASDDTSVIYRNLAKLEVILCTAAFLISCLHVYLAFCMGMGFQNGPANQSQGMYGEQNHNEIRECAGPIAAITNQLTGGDFDANPFTVYKASIPEDEELNYLKWDLKDILDKDLALRAKAHHKTTAMGELFPYADLIMDMRDPVIYEKLRLAAVEKSDDGINGSAAYFVEMLRHVSILMFGESHERNRRVSKKKTTECWAKVGALYAKWFMECHFIEQPNSKKRALFGPNMGMFTDHSTLVAVVAELYKSGNTVAAYLAYTSGKRYLGSKHKTHSIRQPIRVVEKERTQALVAMWSLFEPQRLPPTLGGLGQFNPYFWHLNPNVIYQEYAGPESHKIYYEKPRDCDVILGQMRTSFDTAILEKTRSDNLPTSSSLQRRGDPKTRCTYDVKLAAAAESYQKLLRTTGTSQSPRELLALFPEDPNAQNALRILDY